VATGKISFFNGKKRAEELLQANTELAQENAQLRAMLEELGAMDALAIRAETERIRQASAAEVDQMRAEIAELKQQQVSLDEKLTATKTQLVGANNQLEMQDVGLYDYHHPAENSTELKAELEQVQRDIKHKIKTKAAITATTNFTFNNSSAQGRKFVSDMSRIMLRAYNAEAENCVKTVKAGSLPTAIDRLRKAVSQIERQGSMIDLGVSWSYQQLRIRELELASAYQMMVQYEREAERDRKAELREQRKAEQELRAERARLQKERDHYTNALAMLESRGDTTGADELRAKLEDVDLAINDVDYRAANIRAGFVYVISNVGAFGPNMVKIGMTRRLEPNDRVRELGDASVPFRFDVHTLFFSEDAVSVETELHRAFAERRVNKVNNRREFFYATPREVLDVLTSQVGNVVEYKSEPDAEEFRLSRGESETVL